MKFRIRFNTDYLNTEEHYWKVFSEDEFFLCNYVQINVPSFTEISLEKGNPHWNVVCYGQMQTIGNQIHINPLS